MPVAVEARSKKTQVEIVQIAQPGKEGNGQIAGSPIALEVFTGLGKIDVKSSLSARRRLDTKVNMAQNDSGSVCGGDTNYGACSRDKGC